MQRTTWTARARMAGALAAVAASAVALAAGGAARATEYDESFAYDSSKLNCGAFGQSVICATFKSFAPIQTQAGDVFNINVSSSRPIVVPGSPTQSLFFVDAFDSADVLGPNPAGGVLTTYTMTPTGFTAPVGQPPPITGPLQSNTTNHYIGFLGYCCGYGEPDNGGFSLTGVNANLRVDAADPRAIVGMAAGYAYVLPELPKTFHDLVGGTVDSPLILPKGLIGEITGSISGDGPENEFYAFTWQGGVFQAEAKILGADPNAVFTFELRSSDGRFVRDLRIDSLSDFDVLFSSLTPLAAGNYLVGLKGSTAFDPGFSLDFLTPIQSSAGLSVPEPSTWALLLAGFGGLGLALRRRRAKVALAAAA